MDAEPKPTSTSIREALLARPDIQEILTPTPPKSITEELLARPDIDEILGEDVTRETLRQKLLARPDINEILDGKFPEKPMDLVSTQSPRGVSRRRFLAGAAVAGAAGVALLGGYNLGGVRRSYRLPPQLKLKKSSQLF